MSTKIIVNLEIKSVGAQELRKKTKKQLVVTLIWWSHGN